MKRLMVAVFLVCTAAFIMGMSLENGIIEIGKVFVQNGITEIRFSVWSSGDPNSVIRVQGIVEATRRINEIWSRNGINSKIVIRETRYELDFTQMYQEFLSKHSLGTAADFLVNSYVYIASLAEEGYLLNISKYAIKYPDLMSDFYATLVDAARYKGGLYGLPQDTEARPLYVRKDIAAKIGLDLSDLSKKVAEGKFTWVDVYTWAKESVSKGASQWGLIHRRGTAHPDLIQFILAFGGQLYNPQTNKLILDIPAVYKWLTIESLFASSGLLPSDIMAWDWAKQVHPAIVEGRTLFDIGGTWYWTEWQTKNYYTDPKTGQARGLTPEEVQSWFYYTLFPAGELGNKPVTLSQPFMWMISSRAGSQNPKYSTLKPNYEELAFLIIAKACDPDINAIHSIISAHLPVSKGAAKLLNDEKWLKNLYDLNVDLDPAVKSVLGEIVKATVHPINAKFLTDVAYMLEYTTFPPMHPMYPKLVAIYAEVVDNVLRGRMQPDKAVEFIISKINADLDLKQSVIIVGQVPTEWKFGAK